MIYLLRHGETVWNTERRLQGRRDSPLTARGIGQARGLGRLLASHIDAPAGCRIIASPLGRAWQSAVLVAHELGQPPQRIELEDRLVELAYGAWEGLTIEEIKQRHAGDWRRRSADRWNQAAPGGETCAELEARVAGWLAETPDGEPLVVVCHGVTSRVLRGHYSGLPRDETLDLDEPQDGLFRLAGGTEERFDAVL